MDEFSKHQSRMQEYSGRCNASLILTTTSIPRGGLLKYLQPLSNLKSVTMTRLAIRADDIKIPYSSTGVLTNKHELEVASTVKNATAACTNKDLALRLGGKVRRGQIPWNLDVAQDTRLRDSLSCYSDKCFRYWWRFEQHVLE
jgi:hypothetical protein